MGPDTDLNIVALSVAGYVYDVFGVSAFARNPAPQSLVLRTSLGALGRLQNSCAEKSKKRKLTHQAAQCSYMLCATGKKESAATHVSPAPGSHVPEAKRPKATWMS